MTRKRVSAVDDLDISMVEGAYDRWAPVYDLLFGKVFAPGRREAIAAAERIGGNILEVGVGTGISLPGYLSLRQAPTSALFGVDISERMLRKAQLRVARLGLDRVKALLIMDAKRLSFPTGSFDVVVAQYVITTVPDPAGTLDELVRVLKPGGEIILLSRVGAERGLRRLLERLLMPLARRLGWRTAFPWQRYQDWVASTPGVRLLERREIPPLGHFSLIRFGKDSAEQPSI